MHTQLLAVKVCCLPYELKDALTPFVFAHTASFVVEYPFFGLYEALRVRLLRKSNESFVHVMHPCEAGVCVMILDVEGVAPHVDAVHADQLPRRFLNHRDSLVAADLEISLELELLLQIFLRDAEDQEPGVVTILLREKLLLDLYLLLGLRILGHVHVVLVKDK